MKKVLILMILTLASCSENNNSTEHNSCGLETTISAVQYIEAPADELTIHHLEINGDCLEINFSAMGCEGDSWELKLIDSEGVYESAPLQRNLRLSLNNEELCNTVITKTVVFDISNLQVDGQAIQLNILNSEQTILYEY